MERQLWGSEVGRTPRGSGEGVDREERPARRVGLSRDCGGEAPRRPDGEGAQQGPCCCPAGRGQGLQGDPAAAESRPEVRRPGLQTGPQEGP